MIIKIENLRLRTVIGIYDWEKEVKQDLVINVSIFFDGEKSSVTDDIKDTVDYKSINKKIIASLRETILICLRESRGDMRHSF